MSATSSARPSRSRASAPSCSRRPSSASGSSAGTGSHRGHLATIYLVWIGDVALRPLHPRRRTHGCSTRSATRSTRRPAGREATDIVDILFQGFVLFAWTHAILAGLVTAASSCSASPAGTSSAAATSTLFRGAAKLAIVVALPVTFVQLGVGSEFGVAVTDVAADEDRRDGGALGHGAAGRRSRSSRSAASPRTTRRRRSTSRSPACSRSSRPTRSTARSSG